MTRVIIPEILTPQDQTEDFINERIQAAVAYELQNLFLGLNKAMLYGQAINISFTPSDKAVKARKAREKYSR